MAVKIKQNISVSEIQKFEGANTPGLPYTLQLVQFKWILFSFVKTEETLLQNKKTNEEFSLRKKGFYDTIEIKRAIKKVEN